MNEIRTDPLTGARVLYVPGRARRPHDTAVPRPAPASGAVATCPFCPGHEDALLGIVDESRPIAGDRAAARAGWQTRTVPNRFPLASATGRKLSGRHEVIIEHPRHDLGLAAMTVPAIAAVIATWQGRLRALAGAPGIRAVTLFRNEGVAAGSSIGHPHSQVVATPFVPPATRSQAARAARYFRRTGRCLACDEIARERKTGERIIATAAGVIVFVPYAARVPGELRILSTGCRRPFTDEGAARRRALARLLKDGLGRIEAAFGASPWNLTLHNAPPGPGCAPHHWSLTVLPRNVTPGGFELETGLSVCPSLPEADAGRLRKIRVKNS
jgi:UDPglucose--hexose-1-phosphate uridylyltransferase